MRMEPINHGKILRGPKKYSVVAGVFRQDEPGFTGVNYDMLQDDFGLLDKSPDGWKKLTQLLEEKNESADDRTTYKLVFVARHGQGYHNLAETKYGTPAWNAKWSLLTGDGETTWGPDPELTDLGKSQAQAANDGWKAQKPRGIPIPQTFYSSPFQRSAETLRITFREQLEKGARPKIKEKFRETISLHTCDNRREKKAVQAHFPEYDIEEGFTEKDELWGKSDETEEARYIRVGAQLDEVFSTDPNPVIAISCHGGVIRSINEKFGHQVIEVLPGGFYPTLVKAVAEL